MKINNRLLYTFIIGLVLNLLFSQECPPTDTLVISPAQNIWDFPSQNQWDQVEVMTWNLKEFPYSDNTVNNVQEAIADILPDIIAFQEIKKIGWFSPISLSSILIIINFYKYSSCSFLLLIFFAGTP